MVGNFKRLYIHATHAVIVKEGSKLVGMAFVCKGDNLGFANSIQATNRNNYYTNSDGNELLTDEVVTRIRAKFEKGILVHELILLCGGRYGVSILLKVIETLSEQVDALLFTNAAYDKDANENEHLWKKVYKERFGFEPVADLHFNVNKEHEKLYEEKPMVTSLTNLERQLRLEQRTSGAPRT